MKISCNLAIVSMIALTALGTPSSDAQFRVVDDAMFVGALHDDTTTYRTATYTDWVTAQDEKYRLKAMKPKFQNANFKFTFVVPNFLEPVDEIFVAFDPVGFNPVFSAGTITKGTTAMDTVAAWTHSTGEGLYGTIFTPGDTFQVEGLVYDYKKLKKVWVEYVGSTTGVLHLLGIQKLNPKDFEVYVPRLPLPNLHNVGEEIYGGTLQTPVNITVGSTSDAKGAHTAYHPKYKDVLKSLVNAQRGVTSYHTALPHCLNTFDKNQKQILKKQKSLPPTKHNNRLFAEQLILKLNVAASDLGIFPPGLGDLIYDNSGGGGSAGPFDGLTIRAIIDSVDRNLGCNGIVAGTADSTEFLKVDSLINAAFAGPMDTISWSSGKVICTGVRPLSDVPYLHANPDATPLTRSPIDPALGNSATASISSLGQNYPNPFNPVTVIEFELATDAAVTVKIYNTIGQEVATLTDHQEFGEGVNDLEFDGSVLPSGIYFYRIAAHDIETGELTFMDVKKMLLVK